MIKTKMFKYLDKLAAEKLCGRIKYLKKYNIYIILIPMGYNFAETIYKDRVFYTLNEIALEFGVCYE